MKCSYEFDTCCYHLLHKYCEDENGVLVQRSTTQPTIYIDTPDILSEVKYANLP